MENFLDDPLLHGRARACARLRSLYLAKSYARAFPRPRRPRERPRPPLPGIFVPCGHVSLPWGVKKPRRIKRKLSGQDSLVSLELRKLSYPDALVSLSVKKQSYLPALCSFLLRRSLCDYCQPGFGASLKYRRANDPAAMTAGDLRLTVAANTPDTSNEA